jgi:hypothetical protein
MNKKNKKGIVVDKNYVDEIVGKLKLTNSDTFKIDPKFASLIENDFFCLICTEIVATPEQCGACDKLICKKCIQTWLTKSNDCPSCRN